MRQSCEQQGREQDAARRIAETEADETREKLAQERAVAARKQQEMDRDLCVMRENFCRVEAEKTKGGFRRAPKRLCNQREKPQSKPPLTVSG